MSDPRIFISHKTIDNSNDKAAHLRSELQRKGFQHIFLDIFSLEAGDNWRQTLLDNLADMDVLIVLIEEATANSNWVQREVDMARGAGTSILPVLVDTDYAAVQEALDRLDMTEKQYIQWDSTRLDDIINRIGDLARETHDRQAQLCKKWELRRQEKKLADHNPYLHTFSHIDVDGVQFHIAGGDATHHTAYEVLVNTENNYMQMARFHENNTLSRHVRVEGANIHPLTGLILEDTVQKDLYEQVAWSEFKALPIREGQVVITPPGHPESDLAKRFRFLLHVAAVELDWFGLRIKSMSTGANSHIVENCLKRVQMIDDQEGRVIYQEDKTLIKPATEPDDYRLIESILFPVFGAGEGGNAHHDAIEGIVDGFLRHVPAYKGHLKHIGLSVYSQETIDIAREVFDQKGFHRR